MDPERPESRTEFEQVQLKTVRTHCPGLDAAIVGLTLPWNFGVVGGHVNRIKMLERQMFGRAGFDVLRKRVLLAP
ncbi:transposase [Streptomyces olivochromogenes]|uniref:Transposase n=1 Tax=Streptomyces olivochromogenes TaxID=1963 RepID=A0A286PGM5_STROL|nr:transposase [Streptomyces olivochromogenes]GAX58704.1 hypothetical protein SO3561_10279 [Streptomyces olivochromogenes]